MIKEYLRELLPAHVRRHLRPGATATIEVHRHATEPWRVTLVDTGEETDDRRPAASASLPYVERRATSASPTATASPTSTSTALHRLPPRARHARRRSPRCSRPAASARSTSTATGSAASRRSRAATARWINGGFFVLRPSVARLPRRRRDGLGAGAAARPRRPTASSACYRHDGFWQPMDTLRDRQIARGALGLGRAAVADLGLVTPTTRSTPPSGAAGASS